MPVMVSDPPFEAVTLTAKLPDVVTEPPVTLIMAPESAWIPLPLSATVAVDAVALTATFVTSITVPVPVAQIADVPMPDVATDPPVRLTKPPLSACTALLSAPEVETLTF